MHFLFLRRRIILCQSRVFIVLLNGYINSCRAIKIRIRIVRDRFPRCIYGLRKVIISRTIRRLKYLTISNIVSIAVARGIWRHKAGEKRFIHNVSTFSFIWLYPADLQFSIEKLISNQNKTECSNKTINSTKYFYSVYIRACVREWGRSVCS